MLMVLIIQYWSIQVRKIYFFILYNCRRGLCYPRSTFCSLSAGMLFSSSDSASLCGLELQGELHSGEQRYCMRGRRNFPQKSTNLMWRTRESKYTPAEGEDV